MFLLFKKLLFKAMELGLGLRPYFPLVTKNPIFINFKLREEEIAAVRAQLPSGIAPKKIKFMESDRAEAYWLSYNLYEVEYPRRELRDIRKVRCEINTFVEDAHGRRGIYVFAGSPYVSREERKSILGVVCDFAERTVMFIYGCGKLIPLKYALADSRMRIEFREGENAVSLDSHVDLEGNGPELLSVDYRNCNDVSFFNRGKTYDRVYLDSSFLAARFRSVDSSQFDDVQIRSAFFRRPADAIYYHRGEIAYLVSAMNRT